MSCDKNPLCFCEECAKRNKYYGEMSIRQELKLREERDKKHREEVKRLKPLAYLV